MVGSLFAKVVPIICLYSLAMWLWISSHTKAESISLPLELGYTYEFLFALANKYGGSDCVFPGLVVLAAHTQNFGSAVWTYQVGLPEERTFAHSSLISI